MLSWERREESVMARRALCAERRLPGGGSDGAAHASATRASANPCRDAFIAARRLLRPFVALAALLAATATAAAAECYPNCDYNHYYGPYDFTYVRPGLYGHPICGPRGECSPYLVYSYSVPPRGRIEIRFRRRPRRAPPQ
jgi:hypothetical protein